MTPTASDIGHGKLGLRSAIRSFDTLVLESQSQKQCFAEIRGTWPVTAWTLYSGSIYSTPIDQSFNGRRLDVVSVRHTTGELTRVETLAGVTAGTFYFDADSQASSLLYIRMPDSSVPGSDQTVWAIFGFYYGNVRVVHPTLGPDKLVDGPLEVWSSATALTNWTTVSSGASGNSLNRDSTYTAQGTYSARLEGTIIPSGYQAISATVAATTVAGKRYRLSGFYRTDTTNPASLVAQVGIYDGSAYQTSDGRSTSSTPLLSLSNTYGEWKRFCFDFVATSTTTTPFLGLGSVNAPGFGKAWFDGVKLQRIYRYEEYDPRLSYEAIPSISEGRRGIFFDRWFLGQGSITLNNDSGHFEESFQTYGFTDATIYTRFGGRFSEDGNEILIEDMFVRRWTSRRVRVKDTEAYIEMDDARTLFNEVLPKRYLQVSDFPSLASVDIGAPRRLIFVGSGALGTAMRMPRITKSTDTDYGIYELLDPQYILTGSTVSILASSVAYADETAASKYDPVKRVLLGQSNASTSGAINCATTDGRYKVLQDVQLIGVESGKNDIVEFDNGGTRLFATIQSGYYLPGNSGSTLSTIGNQLKSEMDAATGGTVAHTISYSQITNKFTISTTSSLSLYLSSTGAGRTRSLFPSLGFTSTSDRTGAATYDSDDSIFTDCDTQHVITTYPTGYGDNASGTYTGSTSLGYISLPGDIFYFLLRNVLNVPTEQIDTDSVASARSGAESLAVVIGGKDGPLEFGEIVSRIEASNAIELLMDGDKWLVRKRDATVPSNITTLGDREILDIEGWWDESDLYSNLIVDYATDENTGDKPSNRFDIPSAKARLGGREKTIEMKTYLPITTSATDYTYNLSINVGTPRRRFRLRVKGACMRKIPGDKVKITRSNFLGRTAAVDYVVVRIISIKHSPDSWVSELECAEVLGTW
jgi:hypothetical protein